MTKKEHIITWLDAIDIGDLGNSSIYWQDDLLMLAQCSTKSMKQADGNSFCEPNNDDFSSKTPSIRSRVSHTPTCRVPQDDTSFVRKIPFLCVNDSNTSWTSSMATTPADGHTLKTDLLESDVSLSRSALTVKPCLNRQPTGAPRVLFSPTQFNDFSVCRLSSGLDMSNVGLLCSETTFSTSEGDYVKAGKAGRFQEIFDAELEVDKETECFSNSLIPIDNFNFEVKDIARSGLTARNKEVGGAKDLEDLGNLRCCQTMVSQLPHHVGNCVDHCGTSMFCNSADESVCDANHFYNDASNFLQGPAVLTIEVSASTNVVNTNSDENLKQSGSRSSNISSESFNPVAKSFELTNCKTDFEKPKHLCAKSLDDNDLSIFFTSPVASRVIKHNRRCAPKRRAHQYTINNALEAIESVVSASHDANNTSPSIEVIDSQELLASQAVQKEVLLRHTELLDWTCAALGSRNSLTIDQPIQSPDVKPTVIPQLGGIGGISSCLSERILSSPANILECCGLPVTVSDVKRSHSRSVCTSTPKAGGYCKIIASPSFTPLGSIRPVVPFNAVYTLPSGPCSTPINCLKFVQTPQKKSTAVNNYETPLRPALLNDSSTELSGRGSTDLCSSYVILKAAVPFQSSTANVEFLSNNSVTSNIRSSPIGTLGTDEQKRFIANGCLVRQRRKFVYPTAAQIADGCPPRVFSFNKGLGSQNLPQVTDISIVPPAKCNVNQSQSTESVTDDKFNVNQCKSKSTDNVPAGNCNANQFQSNNRVPADKCNENWLDSTEYCTDQSILSALNRSFDEPDQRIDVPNNLVPDQLDCPLPDQVNQCSDSTAAQLKSPTMLGEKDWCNVGFRSAAGKQISVSEKAKAKANELMEQVRQEYIDMTNSDDLLPRPYVGLFEPEKPCDDYTVAGKMSEFHSNIASTTDSSDAKHSVGFSSAGGTSLCVKKESLLKAMSLVETVVLEENSVDTPNLDSIGVNETAKESRGGMIFKRPRLCNKVNLLDYDHSQISKVKFSGECGSDCRLPTEINNVITAVDCIVTVEQTKNISKVHCMTSGRQYHGANTVKYVTSTSDHDTNQKLDCESSAQSVHRVNAINRRASQPVEHQVPRVEHTLYGQQDCNVCTVDLTSTQRAEVDLASLLAIQQTDVFISQSTSNSQYSCKSGSIGPSSKQCCNIIKNHSMTDGSTHIDVDTELLLSGEQVLNCGVAFTDTQAYSAQYKCKDLPMEVEDTMPEGVSLGWNTQDAELDKAMSLFDIDSLHCKSKRNEVSCCSADNDVPTTCLFKTAKGNSVDISMKSLNRQRQLIKDVGQLVINEQSSGTLVAHYSCNEPGECVFQTARGNAVKISEESLIRARNVLLQEDESVILNKPSNETVLANDSHIVPASCLFQTARGNAVKISDDSLSKVGNLMLDCEPTVFVEPSGGITVACDGGNFPATCIFQTARGGTVKISDESLNRARHLLLLENESVVLQEPSRGTVVANDSSCGPTAYAFQTAGGNAVKITDESLSKARNLLQSDKPIVFVETCSAISVANNDINLPTACVFQTARGGSVEINDESLSKTRKPLQEGKLAVFVKPSEETIVAGDCGKLLAVCVFQTARGSSVEISDESLNKARNQLKDDGLKQIDELSMETIVADNSDKVQKTKLCAKIQATASYSLSITQNTAESKENNLFKTAKENASVGYSETRKLLSNAQSTVAEDQAGIRDLETFYINTRLLQQVSTAAENVTTPFHESNQSVVSGTEKTVDDAQTMFEMTDRNESILIPPVTGVKCDVSSIKDYNTYSASKTRQMEVASTGHYRVQCADGSRTPVYSVPEKFNADRRHCYANMKPLNSECLFDVPVNLSENHSRCQQAELTYLNTQQSTRRNVCQFFTPYKKYVDRVSCTPTVLTSLEHGYKPPIKVYNKVCSCAKKNAVTSQSYDCNVHSVAFDYGQQLKSSVVISKAMCDNKSVAARSSYQHSDQKIVDSENRDTQLNVRQAQLDRIALRQHRQSDITVAAGHYWLTRNVLKHKRISLKEAVDGRRPTHLQTNELYACGVSKETQAVSAANAENFHFKVSDWLNDIDHMHVGDNTLLVFNESGHAGKEEFSNALMDTKGVSPRLISSKWVENHYRWIIWKLAAMEVAFPEYFGGRCLTPHNVMLQLKYRYDVEIDNSLRSALKKIYEQDDTARKSMVLCVSAKHDESTLQLTDGWYSIQTLLDAPLSQLVQNGRIRIGDKLYIYGADLIGVAGACSPLEAPDNVKLKIYANSTRRSLWNAKLGYQPCSQPPIVSLSSLFSDGGPVPGIDVIITRVYPLQFLEKLPDGSTLTRSELAEEKAAQCHEKERQCKMEMMYTQLQREEEQQSSISRVSKTVASKKSEKKLSSSHISGITSVDELYEAYMSTTDPDLFETLLQPTQLHALREYITNVQQRIELDKQETVRLKVAEMDNVVAARNVTSFVRVQIAGCSRVDIDRKSKLILTVWRPTEEVIHILREGSRLLVFNLMAKAARGRGVSLSTTRFTRYDHQTNVDDHVLDLVYEPREATKFTNISQCASSTEEIVIDTVGLVVGVNVTLTASSLITTVYLADCDDYFLAVKFYGKLEVYAVDSVLCVGAVVACSNLQCRSSNFIASIPNVVASEMSTFTVKTPPSHLRIAMMALRSKVKSCTNLLENLQSNLVKITLAKDGVCFARTGLDVSTKLLPHTPMAMDVMKYDNISVHGKLTQKSGVVSESLRHSFLTSDNLDTPPTVDRSALQARKRRLGSGVSVGRKALKLSTTADI